MYHQVAYTDKLKISADSGRHYLHIENLQTMLEVHLEAPSFELNGATVGGDALKFLRVDAKRSLKNGGQEFPIWYALPQQEGLHLKVLLRVFPVSSFIRFRLELITRAAVTLTKKDGRDNLYYTGFSMPAESGSLTEIQFSQLNPSYIHLSSILRRRTFMILRRAAASQGPSHISDRVPAMPCWPMSMALSILIPTWPFTASSERMWLT